MEKIELFETEREAFRRKRSENVVKEYLQYATLILQKKITVNRVCHYLADRYEMSADGIKLILRRNGVYVNAKNPVVYPATELSKQLSLNFLSENGQEEPIQDAGVPIIEAGGKHEK